MKKYFTEFLGTFFWVLTFVMTLNNGSGPYAPFAIGAMVAAMVHSGFRYSQAHFNPAVSVSLLMLNKIDKRDFIFYIFAQLFGSSLAASVGVLLLRCVKVPDIPMHSNEAVCALIAEFIGTFGLVWVVLNAYFPERNSPAPNSVLPIGLTLTAGAILFSPVSLALFNPAVAFGACIAGMVHWDEIWIYIAAQLLGSAGASSVFRVFNEPL